MTSSLNAASDKDEMLKFVPWQSTAEPSFWLKLGELKLDTLRLSEEAVPISGSFGIQGVTSIRAGTTATTVGIVPGRMRLDQDSLLLDNWNGNKKNEVVHMSGKIQILNTLESFKAVNKNQLLEDHCLPSLLSNLSSGEEMTSFFCLAHLDLKSHKVLYWFAFPVLVPTSPIYYSRKHPQMSLKRAWGEEKVHALHRAFTNLRIEQYKNSGKTCPPFFIIVKHGDQVVACKPLEAYHQAEKEHYSFAFVDPTVTTSTNEGESMPLGWTLRNLISHLTIRLDLGTQDVEIVSFRPGVIRRIALNDGECNLDSGNMDASLLLNVRLPHRNDYQWPTEKKYKCTGWELNARSKPGPRTIDLSPLLSSSHLAQQAVHLNLKLMKWRMIPNLNLDTLSSLKVLILGAGTLGCNVARTLLAWGVQNYTFVDNGKVSYSNPVRQSLYNLEDCELGGKDKATAAAQSLHRIANVVESKGVVLSIPMPGHTFHEELESARDAVETLHRLIEESDVVFIGTDTRESRWLPTVMARCTETMLINAALGLDSWLVMRHGGGNVNDRLGCYFCNDVVAPENSTNNQTLDQQCTVTRPGLAPIAASMAVELMVSLLHHELRENAPAPPMTSQLYTPSLDEASYPLGRMPHQIRGSLVSYTIMTPTVPAFPYCTGCCQAVVDTYKDEGFEFVKMVCCDATSQYLENVAGLTKFREEASFKMKECLDWDEEEDDEEEVIQEIVHEQDE